MAIIRFIVIGLTLLFIAKIIIEIFRKKPPMTEFRLVKCHKCDIYIPKTEESAHRCHDAE